MMHISPPPMHKDPGINDVYQTLLEITTISQIMVHDTIDMHDDVNMSMIFKLKSLWCLRSS